MKDRLENSVTGGVAVVSCFFAAAKKEGSGALVSSPCVESRRTPNPSNGRNGRSRGSGEPAAFGSGPNGDASPTTPALFLNGVAVDAGIDSGVPLALACVTDVGVDALRRGPPSEAASRVRDPGRTGHDTLSNKLNEGDSGDSEPAVGGGVVGIGEAARRDPLVCPERAFERGRRDFFGVKDPAPRLNSTFSPGAFVSSASIGEPGGDFEDTSKPSGPDGTQVGSPRSPSPSSEEE